MNTSSRNIRRPQEWASVLREILRAAPWFLVLCYFGEAPIRRAMLFLAVFIGLRIAIHILAIISHRTMPGVYGLLHRRIELPRLF